MSEFSIPQPVPNDPPFEGEAFLSSQNARSLKPDQKQIMSEQFLYPIDESNDFYDPFSDLSLFLSNQVKKEIQISGSTQKWSNKIECNLLAKILPEFKKEFPRYRLGAAALKKVWEKVNYYYEKLKSHKGALKQNGKLNLPLMIRENLKTSGPLLSSLNLPPHHLSHQIAIKMSECIATLEGRRCDLDHLTKMIWAVQKNTLSSLSPTIKSPYEDHDKIDKLIVKTLLEICAESPQINLKALQKEIFTSLRQYRNMKPLVTKNELTITLSMLLAEKLCQTPLTKVPERGLLERFIEMQMSPLSSDVDCIEFVQQLLSLYSIATTLPQNLSEKTLRLFIRNVFNRETPLPTNASLHTFISAEIHLMCEKTDFQDLENKIITLYHLSLKLPELNRDFLEIFELLIWKKLNEKKKFLEKIPKETLSILERELGNIAIDQPHQSFRGIVRGTIQFFKKIQQLPLDEKGETLFWLNVKKKIEIWSLQNEMVSRWIHFNTQAPLFTFFQKEWKSRANEEQFLENLQKKAIKLFPLLNSFDKQLKTRLWVLNQYSWYSNLANDSESCYDCFLKKYLRILRDKYPESSPKSVIQKLKKLSHNMLPLTPFKNVSLDQVRDGSISSKTTKSPQVRYREG